MVIFFYNQYICRVNKLLMQIYKPAIRYKGK